MDITYRGNTLTMLCVRGGLREAIKQVSAAQAALSFGFEARPQIPAIVRDDWSNTDHGYGFVTAHDYLPPDALLQHLLGSPEAGLLREDGDRGLCLSEMAIDKLLQSHAQVHRDLLMPLMLQTSTWERAREFADIKIVNSIHKRNLFMHGAHLWAVDWRAKAMAREVGVRHLLPLEVAQLVLYEVLVLRPALVKLIRLAKGDAPSVLYSQYLWVAPSAGTLQRITPCELSAVFSRFTERFFGVALSTSARRHILPQMLPDPTADVQGHDGDDETMAQARGHTAHMQRTMYAVEEGHPPLLRRDLLFEHHQVSAAQWAQVLGLGPGSPPAPPRCPVPTLVGKLNMGLDTVRCQNGLPQLRVPVVLSEDPDN